METDSSNNFKVPVVNWSHGILQPDAANKLQCEVLSDIQNPQNIIAVLASDFNDNAYLSKRDESPYCNNFVIIRNKKTNDIRLYGTENFLMLPYRSRAEPKNNSQVKSEEKSIIQNATLSLNKAMGSKRNKKRVIEIEKGDIHVDDVEKKVKKAIKDNELVVKEEIETVSSNQTCLPPCNRDADSVEEVYKINDLISSEVLNNLESISREILEMNVSELSADKRLSEFFLKTFAQICKKTPLKIKLLLFADSLLKFLNTSIRELRKKFPVICTYSSVLNKKLLQDFCVALIDGKLGRPPSMRDKALCYMLVVLLLINDFTIDMSLLSGQLTPQEYQKLPKLLRAVGAKPDKNSGVNFSLKLPLAELSLNNRRSGNFGSKKR